MSYTRKRYIRSASGAVVPAPARASLSEDEDRPTRMPAPRPSSPLSPPRPSFLTNTRDRGSWSSDPSLDSDRETTPPIVPSVARQSWHSRPRSVTSSTAYVPVAPTSPDAEVDSAPPTSDPFSASASLRSATHISNPILEDAASPQSATHPLMGHSPRHSFSRAVPPSAYPFQAYPGNPDPLPGLRSRRASFDSLFHRPHTSSAEGSYEADFERPYAPFMAQDPNQVYRNVPSNSALHGTGVGMGADHTLNPRGSTISFRAPFLSPASRPNSVWAPPLYATPGTPGTPQLPGTGTSTPLPGPKPPLPSTLLAEKLQMEDKPWMRERDRRSRASWWITALMFLLGVGGAAILCYRAYVAAGESMIDDSQLCSVMSDDFNSLDVDGDNSVWKRDVSLGGFGNNEFQMTTALSDNLFTRNGQLYIMPTLTTDKTGMSVNDLLDGGKYSLDGCTADSQQNCTVTASKNSGTTVQPIMSARLTTKSSVSIRYGKVEVVAKLPQGDWLWPAIWMLPVENKYGPWPLSGEIDIMEARGNGISYPQGVNYVRSTLNWGPLESLITRLYGWQSQKRTTFAASFHTYTLEWTDSFMKAYVDSRLTAMIDIKVRGSGGKSFWDRGNYPDVAQNGSTQVVVENPYGGSASAPFDQNFYLILDLAAGGTSGWFQDNAGNKPWFDASATALRDFTGQQDTWSKTWPDSDDDRAFRIDSVKMWKLC